VRRVGAEGMNAGMISNISPSKLVIRRLRRVIAYNCVCEYASEKLWKGGVNGVPGCLVHIVDRHHTSLGIGA